MLKLVNATNAIARLTQDEINQFQSITGHAPGKTVQDVRQALEVAQENRTLAGTPEGKLLAALAQDLHAKLLGDDASVPPYSSAA